MKDTFESYHPLVNFLYFSLVLGFSMVLVHPLAQLISCICAIYYGVQTEGRRAVLFSIRFCLPVLLITAFMNPAFNHQGRVILCYMVTGNPLTLESILYGLSAGCMLMTVLLWFRSFNRVITSDKFIYLFGRIIPALSLVLSMTLRFVPKFKNQMELVMESQKSIGRDISEGSFLQRTKTAVLILSIMITWSLENAIETADSMKSRGYGLRGRSAFSIYRFEERDRCAMGWLIFCGIYLLCGCISGGFAFRYFPSIRMVPFSGHSVTLYGAYLGLCIMPVILNFTEERKWKALYLNM